MKILFFDIDGTLVSNDGKRIFPENAKEAIRLTRQYGNLAVINTGRVRCNVEKWILDAGFDGMISGCGTDIVYHGAELLHHTIPQQLCREIGENCRKWRIPAIFEYRDYTSYDGTLPFGTRGEMIAYFRREGRKLISDIHDPEFRFDKFSGFYLPDSDRAAFRNYITRNFTYIDRENDFFELEPAGFSKATGIRFLLDALQISEGDAYVFGDSNNDIEMMQAVPHSICMGNGSPEAKMTASYVTGDLYRNGLADAMRHFRLI